MRCWILGKAVQRWQRSIDDRVANRAVCSRAAVAVAALEVRREIPGVLYDVGTRTQMALDRFR